MFLRYPLWVLLLLCSLCPPQEGPPPWTPKEGDRFQIKWSCESQRTSEPATGGTQKMNEYRFAEAELRFGASGGQTWTWKRVHWRYTTDDAEASVSGDPKDPKEFVGVRVRTAGLDAKARAERESRLRQWGKERVAAMRKGLQAPGPVPPKGGFVLAPGHLLDGMFWSDDAPAGDRWERTMKGWECEPSGEEAVRDLPVTMLRRRGVEDWRYGGSRAGDYRREYQESANNKDWTLRLLTFGMSMVLEGPAVRSGNHSVERRWVIAKDGRLKSSEIRVKGKYDHQCRHAEHTGKGAYNAVQTLTITP